MQIPHFLIHSIFPRNIVVTVISDRDLLTQPEIVSVFRSHYGVRNILFSENIRKPLEKRTTSTLTRHGSTTSQWTSRGIDALKITPDSDIWLKGFSPRIPDILPFNADTTFSDSFNISKEYCCLLEEMFAIGPNMTIPFNQISLSGVIFSASIPLLVH
jgi:hypothetical protein